MRPKNRPCRSKFSLFISRFFHVQKFKSSTFVRSVPSSTQPHVRIMRALFHAQSPKFSQALSSLFGLPAAHRLTRFSAEKVKAAATCHRHAATALRIYLRLKSKNPDHPDGCSEFLVGEGGFEPPKSLTTDLQSAPFGHSGIPPY